MMFDKILGDSAPMSCWAQRSIWYAGRIARRDRRCFAALSM